MTELFTDTVLNMMTTTAEPEDYTGEDGLLYCGKCRTAKEAYFPKETAAWLGHDKHPTECDCQREKGKLNSIKFKLYSNELPLRSETPSTSLIPSLPEKLAKPMPKPAQCGSKSLSQEGIGILIDLICLRRS